MIEVKIYQQPSEQPQYTTRIILQFNMVDYMINCVTYFTVLRNSEYCVDSYKHISIFLIQIS